MKLNLINADLIEKSQGTENNKQNQELEQRGFYFDWSVGHSSTFIFQIIFSPRLNINFPSTLTFRQINYLIDPNSPAC